MRLATRLLGIDRRRLCRWLYGYTFEATGLNEGFTHEQPPLWEPQYDQDDDAIGLPDLLEARIALEMVRAGLHLQVLRECHEQAQRICGVAYPLSTGRLATDGQTLLLDDTPAGCAAKGPLLDLRALQYTIVPASRPALCDDIDYEDGQPRRWFPMGRQVPVVLDPARRADEALVLEAAVPTRRLYTAARRAKDRDRLARRFGIGRELVDAAVLFEQTLRC